VTTYANELVDNLTDAQLRELAPAMVQALLDVERLNGSTGGPASLVVEFKHRARQSLAPLQEATLQKGAGTLAPWYVATTARVVIVLATNKAAARSAGVDELRKLNPTGTLRTVRPATLDEAAFHGSDDVKAALNLEARLTPR
jgi:hypothetical protein